MSSLLPRFNALPRAVRWLTYAAALLAAWYLVAEPVIRRTENVRSKADALAMGLARERELSAPESEGGWVISAGQTTFGAPAIPGDAGVRPEAIHRRVDGVLEKFGVTDRTKIERSGSLAGSQTSAIVPGGGGGKVERLILELSFETDPVTLVEIVAALEQAKEVTSVSRIKADKNAGNGRGESGGGGGGGAGRRLRATVVVESWVTGNAGRASAASAGGTQ